VVSAWTVRVRYAKSIAWPLSSIDAPMTIAVSRKRSCLRVGSGYSVNRPSCSNPGIDIHFSRLDQRFLRPERSGHLSKLLIFWSWQAFPSRFVHACFIQFVAALLANGEQASLKYWNLWMRGVVSHRGSLTNRLLSKIAVSRGQRARAVSQNAVSCRGFESLERYGRTLHGFLS
jgi:hypothetical protein